jgi:redox-sensitive bicupin YhaK (pirin superfamily)
MSHTEALEPDCSVREDAVELVISGGKKDLGGFSVRRILPAPARRAVGPFIFFDEMGPAEFPPGEGIDVRPHPHIGLATVTYLFDGEILHRDSLGYVQPIQPGAVNLMTAGRGIVHSERTSPERKAAGQKLHGIQTWMALPEADQEMEPAFVHHPGGSLPSWEAEGVTVTLIIGELQGKVSPVEVRAETLYLDLIMTPGSRFTLDDTVAERGIYVVSGSLALGGCSLTAGSMAVLRPGTVDLEAAEGTRLMVVGGEAMGPRTLWWNLVSTDPARVRAAAEEWKAGGFASVPGDDEFIPLPDRPLPG